MSEAKTGKDEQKGAIGETTGPRGPRVAAKNFVSRISRDLIRLQKRRGLPTSTYQDLPGPTSTYRAPSGAGVAGPERGLNCTSPKPFLILNRRQRSERRGGKLQERTESWRDRIMNARRGKFTVQRPQSAVGTRGGSRGNLAVNPCGASVCKRFLRRYPCGDPCEAVRCAQSKVQSLRSKV
jgi:hypothetical protein